MAQDNQNAMLKMMKCIRNVEQQSINCTPFKAHFGRTANTMWHNLVKPRPIQNLNWDRIMLCLDRGRRMMCRDRRDHWDSLDHIEDAEIDRSDSSSDEFSKPIKYVPTSAGSPVKVLRKLTNKPITISG